MCDHDSTAHFACQALQLFFEQVVPVAVCAAAVTQKQDGGAFWIEVYAKGRPPPPKVVANKSCRFMGVADAEIAFVGLDIVNPVRLSLSIAVGPQYALETSVGSFDFVVLQQVFGYITWV